MKLMNSRTQLYILEVQKVDGGSLKMARKVRVKLRLLETLCFEVVFSSNLHKRPQGVEWRPLHFLKTCNSLVTRQGKIESSRTFRVRSPKLGQNVIRGYGCACGFKRSTIMWVLGHIYGSKRAPQFLKASHTLDQNNVKQNQFMVPTIRASSIEDNHNSQKLHTLLIKTV